jgi:hypothetical protein
MKKTLVLTIIITLLIEAFEEPLLFCNSVFSKKLIGF